MERKKVLILSFIFIFILIFLSESSQVNAAAKSYILISNKKSEMWLREHYDFKVKSVGLKNTDIIWWVSDKSIGTIDSDTGRFYAKKEGTVKVTAKDRNSGKISVCYVNVIKKEQPFEILNPLDEFWCGVSYDFEMKDRDAKNIIWCVTDPDLATIDQDGIFLGKKQGEVTVIAVDLENKLVTSCKVKLKDIEETPVEAFNIEIHKIDGTNEEEVIIMSIKDTSYIDIKIPAYYEGKKIAYLNWEVFSNHKRIRTLIIPDNIRVIPDAAGLGNSDLETFVILDRSNNALFGAPVLAGTKLKEFIVPYNCKLSLWGGTFCNNKYLERVIIPNDTGFDWGVFMVLHDLEIRFPGTINKLGMEIFSECKNITLIIPETITVIDKNFIYDCENVTIITPKGSVAEQYALKNKFKVINY